MRSWLKAATFRGAQHVFSNLGLYSNELVTLRLSEASREQAEVVHGALPRYRGGRAGVIGA